MVQYDFICKLLISLHLQRFFLQIRSHSQVPEAKHVHIFLSTHSKNHDQSPALKLLLYCKKTKQKESMFSTEWVSEGGGTASSDHLCTAEMAPWTLAPLPSSCFSSTVCDHALYRCLGPLLQNCELCSLMLIRSAQGHPSRRLPIQTTDSPSFATPYSAVFLLSTLPFDVVDSCTVWCIA
jgi:hypothetical protein